MTKNDVAGIRREYKKQQLDESDIFQSPFDQFEAWMEQALNSDLVEPTAMTLATASSDGYPTARTVLLKKYDEQGYVFYTNYSSRKGAQLDQNPRACLLFFWPELERQIRIEGHIEKEDREQSEAYFNSRPFKSRVAALVSQQSSPVKSRKQLEEEFEALKEKYEDGEVPLPDDWGGYRLKPVRFEFWQGRRSRMHDRIEYELQQNDWIIRRLAP